MTLYRFTQYYYVPDRRPKKEPENDEFYGYIGVAVILVILALVIKGLLS